jgi:hypothetical protein
VAADDDDDKSQAADGDEVTETEESSWLQRIGQSFAGVIFGVILIIAACVVLFWNEGRAVKTARSLSEGAGVVQTVAADKLDPANEGKLIHVVGMLAAAGSATDKEFGMKSSGARLVRHVEMFQWTEESESDSKKNLGGSETTKTTYKYTRAWMDKPVDSSKFKQRKDHTNPQMTYRNRNGLAPQIKLGVFSVPDGLLRDFGTEETLPAGDDQATALQNKVNKPVQVADGVLYIGKDPAQPAVGDFKISFGEVRLQTASVVARQAGSTFEPYRTQAGGMVQLISAGQVASADMFKEAQDTNRMWTWIIRGGGVVAMFIGFALLMGPIGMLADVVPVLGDVVRAGTSLIGLLCTAVLAPVVIAVAWFVYRPVVAVGVLVVGAALAYGAIWLARQRRGAKAAKAAPAT